MPPGCKPPEISGRCKPFRSLPVHASSQWSGGRYRFGRRRRYSPRRAAEYHEHHPQGPYTLPGGLQPGDVERQNLKHCRRRAIGAGRFGIAHQFARPPGRHLPGQAPTGKQPAGSSTQPPSFLAFQMRPVRSFSSHPTIIGKLWLKRVTAGGSGWSRAAVWPVCPSRTKDAAWSSLSRNALVQVIPGSRCRWLISSPRSVIRFVD